MYGLGIELMRPILTQTSHDTFDFHSYPIIDKIIADEYKTLHLSDNSLAIIGQVPLIYTYINPDWEFSWKTRCQTMGWMSLQTFKTRYYHVLIIFPEWLKYYEITRYEGIMCLQPKGTKDATLKHKSFLVKLKKIAHKDLCVENYL